MQINSDIIDSDIVKAFCLSVSAVVDGLAVVAVALDNGLAVVAVALSHNTIVIVVVGSTVLLLAFEPEEKMTITVSAYDGEIKEVTSERRKDIC